MKNFKHLLLSTVVAIAQAATLFVANGVASAQSIVMASTTSTEQSGLFAHLLPAFKQATGIEVKVVALGTGQALDMGRRGDADVLFVHDQVAEEKLVADGFAVKRYPVMYNDFVLIGPKADPAGVSGKDIVGALKKLVAGNGPFVSRGDKSGTHAAELRYWKAAGAPPLTMVFASHNLGQVKRLARRVIYLEQGRVLADLPVEQFFNRNVLRLVSPQAELFLKGELL